MDEPRSSPPVVGRSLLDSPPLDLSHPAKCDNLAPLIVATSQITNTTTATPSSSGSSSSHHSTSNKQSHHNHHHPSSSSHYHHHHHHHHHNQRLNPTSQHIPADGRELIKRGRLFSSSLIANGSISDGPANNNNNNNNNWSINSHDLYGQSIGQNSIDSRDSFNPSIHYATTASATLSSNNKTIHCNVPSVLHFDASSSSSPHSPALPAPSSAGGQLSTVTNTTAKCGNHAKRNMDWAANLSPAEDDDELAASDDKWSQSRIRMAGGREIFSASRLQWSKKRLPLDTTRKSVNQVAIRDVGSQTFLVESALSETIDLSTTTTTSGVSSSENTKIETDLMHLDSDGPSDGERMDSIEPTPTKPPLTSIAIDTLTGKYSKVFDVIQDGASSYSSNPIDVPIEEPPLVDLLDSDSRPQTEMNLLPNNSSSVLNMNREDEDRDDGIESDVENAMEVKASVKRNSSDGGCSDRPEASGYLYSQQQQLHSTAHTNQRLIHSRKMVKPKAPGYPQRVMQGHDGEQQRRLSTAAMHRMSSKGELFKNERPLQSDPMASDEPEEDDEDDDDNDDNDDGNEPEDNEERDGDNESELQEECQNLPADADSMVIEYYPHLVKSFSKDTDDTSNMRTGQDTRKSEQDITRLADISCDELVKSMLYIPTNDSNRLDVNNDLKTSNDKSEMEDNAPRDRPQRGHTYHRSSQKGSRVRSQRNRSDSNQSIDSEIDKTSTDVGLLPSVSASQRLFLLTESDDNVSKFKSNAIVDTNHEHNRSMMDHLSQTSLAGLHLLDSSIHDQPHPTDLSNSRHLLNDQVEQAEILVEEKQLQVDGHTANELAGETTSDSFVAHVDQLRLLHERVQQHVLRETLIDQRPIGATTTTNATATATMPSSSNDNRTGNTSLPVDQRNGLAVPDCHRVSLDHSMRRLSLSSELNANPATSDCESNELPSELSVESSVDTCSRLAAMPVLEDGLSSAGSDSESSDESLDAQPQRAPTLSSEGLIVGKGIKRCSSIGQSSKSSGFGVLCNDRSVHSLEFEAIESLSHHSQREFGNVTGTSNGLSCGINSTNANVGNSNVTFQQSQSPQQQQQLELFAKCRPRNKKLASSRSCDNNDVNIDKELKYGRDSEHDCVQPGMLLPDPSLAPSVSVGATRTSRSSNALNNGSLGNGSSNSYVGPPTSGCPSNGRSHAYSDASCCSNGHLSSSDPVWSTRTQHYDNSMGSGSSEQPNQATGVLVKVGTNDANLDERNKSTDKHLEEDCDTDQETDRLLGAQRNDERTYYEEKNPPIKKKSNSREVLIEGVLFRARYLGSTQLICEGQPTKATRMMQAEEAVSRIKAPEGETQPSTEVDLFISTEKIMVLNTDLKEIMMDHTLRTISYIADIGDLLVLMARRRQPLLSTANGSSNACATSPSATDASAESKYKRSIPKMICHVFESEEAQFIAQSIGQAFQVAYMEFLKANGIDDSSFVKELDYQEVLNSQEIFGNELEMFARKEKQKEVVVPKQKGEILGMVIVESGWGSMLPTVVIANMSQQSPSARCGQLNIGDQIIAINGISLVGLPLGTCQRYIKNTKNQTVVKLTVVPCAPVVEVRIRRPDTKYQLGFSVQNGVICSLLRGGIAERGGVRVGHRIIEINGQSVVAVPHERIVNLLATSVGEIHMKTMPTSMFRLLTGQESPMFI